MVRKRVITKEWRNLILTSMAAALLLGILLKTSTNGPVFPIDTPKASQTIASISVVSDSFADEYQADDRRGGKYAHSTFNWIEQLVKFRGLDFGPYGNWGGIRRTGYEYNFSRSGSTTASMLHSGAPEQLAAYVAAGKIELIYYQLGTNDFDSENTPFQQIYNGKLAGEMLETYLAGVFSNISSTIATINQSNKAKVMIALIADPTSTSRTRRQYSDPVKLKRVSSAIATLNARLRVYATSQHYTILDRSSAPLPTKTTSGDDPRNYFLSDGVHPGTIASGEFANTWIARVTQAYGVHLIPFTRSELEHHANFK